MGQIERSIDWIRKQDLDILVDELFKIGTDSSYRLSLLTVKLIGVFMDKNRLSPVIDELLSDIGKVVSITERSSLVNAFNEEYGKYKQEYQGQNGGSELIREFQSWFSIEATSRRERTDRYVAAIRHLRCYDSTIGVPCVESFNEETFGRLEEQARQNNPKGMKNYTRLSFDSTSESLNIYIKTEIQKYLIDALLRILFFKAHEREIMNDNIQQPIKRALTTLYEEIVISQPAIMADHRLEMLISDFNTSTGKIKVTMKYSGRSYDKNHELLSIK